jgi:nucleoside-diphosphate-sugar epimerase
MTGSSVGVGSGRVRIAIGRASDFFGAGVTESTLGERVFANAVADKRADFIGNPDLPHTYSYVPDIAAGLAVLGTDERAVGQVWHLPGPETVTTRAVLDLIASEVGHPVPVRSVPKLVLRSPRTGQSDDARAGGDVLPVRAAVRPRHHQVRVHVRSGGTPWMSRSKRRSPGTRAKGVRHDKIGDHGAD